MKTLFNQRTFGSVCEKLDIPRLLTQLEVIRDYMLRSYPRWLTVPEIKQGIKHTVGPEYPENSIQAQLRHLRKPQFGSYIVDKKRRVPGGGTYEYLVYPKQI